MFFCNDYSLPIIVYKHCNTFVSSLCMGTLTGISESVKQGTKNIGAFVTRLITKALDGNFADRDSMISDKLVSGCTRKKCHVIH